jgi:thiol-disulfide isomerase/thioredoxin
LDEDDEELQAIRERRLQELRTKQMEKAENVAKGHGQYRHISQDEFLPECTSSRHVVIHFFHGDFERCKIMDHHLKIIAEQHMECKFLKIDSEKAPFFVNKLQVKTLPSLLVFCEGKSVARLIGFMGLAPDPKKPDEFESCRLQEWLSETGAIDYTPSPKVLEEEMARLGLKVRKPICSGGIRNYDEE